jgi:hypothetical protein
VVINADGQRVLSRRIVNDETALTDLIRTVKDLAGDGPVQWAIDLNSGGAALLITLLLDGDQDLLYPRTYRAPRLSGLPRRRQDRCQGRCDHRRPSTDAQRPPPIPSP